MAGGQTGQSPVTYPLEGGLDLVTPDVAKPSGRASAAVNYEPAADGYRRVDGYERFDGKQSPSTAEFWVLPFNLGSVPIVAGADLVTSVLAVTACALVDAIVDSGSYAAGTAAGRLVVGLLSDTPVVGSSISADGVPSAYVAGPPALNGATNDADAKAWRIAAIECARMKILPVPGSGPVQAVWSLKGEVYAIRQGGLFRATPTGWVGQDPGETLAFTSGGTDEIGEGDVITGATSTAVAVVRRVVLDSGTWAGGDAAGRLIIYGRDGNFVAEDLNVGLSLNSATIAANAMPQGLPPEGRYDIRNHNFYGAADKRRTYACNGQGPAFEWDGQVLVTISTGTPDDRPTHIAVHHNQLFLAFRGGSLQNSAIGNPYSWNALAGAAEIGLGTNITGLLESIAGGVLAVFGENRVATLYGNDSTDFTLSIIAEDSGGQEWTSQMVGKPLYADRIGIRSMTATADFGDFNLGTISLLAEPLFRSIGKSTLTAVASLRVRGKDQYRIYWSNGYGLTFYFGKKQVEMLPFLIPNVPTAISSTTDDGENQERLFFGDADGYVYQIDSGTSFDGAAVEAFLRLPFNSLRAPSISKRLHKVELLMDALDNTQIGVVAQFDYADEDQPSDERYAITVSGKGGLWDEALWSEFLWSAAVRGRADVHIDGIGRNVSIMVLSNATYEDPHTLQVLTLHLSARGLVK